MTKTIDGAQAVGAHTGWLKRYYFTRAAFSIVWVCLAFIFAAHSAIVVALLLVYPAWDAIANVVDAQRNGGILSNGTQAFNAAVSTITTIAVAVALTHSMNDVLRVFGVWAALSGLLQLATAARRWKSASGQWPMIISGIQSAGAGISFLLKANAPEAPHITIIAPYAAFGALYFLIAASAIAVGEVRRARP